MTQARRSSRWVDRMTMLEKLHEIDWSGIHHAYGPCWTGSEEVEKLCSDDPKDCMQAVNYFVDFCHHQQTHYEANQYFYLFILEVAANPNVPHRKYTWHVLLSWICGETHLILPSPTNQNGGDVSLGTHNVRVELWRDNFPDTMSAIWRDRDRLSNVLASDPVAAFRGNASNLLGALLWHSQQDGGYWYESKPTSWYESSIGDEIVNAVATAAKLDQDPGVAVSSCLNLGLLANDSRARELVRHLHQLGPSPAIRFAACLARWHWTDSRLAFRLSPTLTRQFGY